MPAWGAVKRRDLIAGLRALGFKGPFSGGNHEFMVRGDLVLTIALLMKQRRAVGRSPRW